MSGLKRFFLNIVRNILFLLVRSKAQPTDLSNLNIDPEKPVCFVLRDKSLSDFLVMDQECKNLGLPRPINGLNVAGYHESNAILFLSEKKGWRTTTQNPEKLHQLVEQVQQQPETDVQLVPVSILWGRHPDKEDSIFKALFSESWAVPGFLRKLFIILIQGRQTLVHFNEPLLIQSVLSEDKSISNERAVRKIGRILRIHFRRQRETITGPDLSHKRTIVNSLLRTDSVKSAIKEETESTKITRKQAEAKAIKYGNEIAADYSYPVIRSFKLMLTRLWTKLYDGVSVTNIDRLQKVANDNEVIYVPCHRSHMDYLLLSFVLHENGHVPPHIAAGINLNMPLIGSFLRKSGAFFLRRSFKGNPLYTAVFNEYLSTVFDRGFPVEYFVEGGRSRTGRLLSPRPGMVSMTIRSFLRTRKRSFVFVPVYFGYERLLEGGTYVGEMHGKKKKNESIFGVIKAFRSIKGTFGKVHVNFGEPIHLEELLDKKFPQWSQDEYLEENPPQWLEEAVNTTGKRIINSINNAAVVNPVSLMSLVILSTHKHAMDENALEWQLDFYLKLLRKAPYSTAMEVTTMSGGEIIAYCEKLEVIIRQKHAFGDILLAVDEKAVLLTYFRNNNIHMFALPSLIACLLINNRQIDATELHRVCLQIFPFIKSELSIYCPQSKLPELINQHIHLLSEAGLLSEDNGVISTPDTSSAEFLSLSVLANTTKQTLERFYMAVQILQQAGSSTLDIKQLEELCTQLAQRISLLHEFNTPEYSDKALFRGFFEAMLSNNVLSLDDNKKLTYDDQIKDANLDAKMILSREVRQTIRQITLAHG
ncbi:glycerol-3-phosphate 1-O-acyltransferase [Gammaproteobacteria bacterium 45_16_T64]|nr:glycerol-3-phosphate 1-O-acyltransferase [Gammaproteobacteria bacterium 45_16_T64]